jgi:hypothetical protein
MPQPSDEQRAATQLDKDVQAILGWPGLHSMCSTPIWVSTLLQALPDAVTLTRCDDDWTATHENLVVTGSTLPTALGRLILAIKHYEA